MNVKDIITEYIKKHNFDGLAYYNCMCTKDDLMNCCLDNIYHCEPFKERKENNNADSNRTI